MKRRRTKVLRPARWGEQSPKGNPTSGAVMVFRPGTHVGDLGKLIEALRDSGLVESFQLFREHSDD